MPTVIIPPTDVSPYTGTGDQVLATAPTLSSPIANSLTGPTTTNLTLAGGSSGASLVLGQGTSGGSTFTPKGTGSFTINNATSGALRQMAILNYGASGSGQEVASLAFNVSTAAETAGAKAGIGMTRSNSNGRGRISFFQNNTNDTNAFTTSNEVAALLPGGQMYFGATSGGSGERLLVYGDADTRVRVNGSSTAGVQFSIADSATGAILSDTTAALRFNGSSAELARIVNSTGNLLIGGTTDITGSGGLKVFGTTASTSTTTGALQVAGGVGVAGAANVGGNLTVSGTGTSSVGGILLIGSASTQDALTRIYRSVGGGEYMDLCANSGGVHGNNQYTLDIVGPNNRPFYIRGSSDGSTFTNRLSVDGSGNATLSGNLTVSGGAVTSGTGTLTLNSSANTVVLQSAGTTALTLDSSQNATFAGKVTATNIFANTTLPTRVAGSATIGGTANAGGQYSGSGAVNDVSLVNKNGDNVMVIPTGTTNATFSGSIAIGNTVAAAAGVSSTHKVTISIGGSTYYLLATNV